MREQRGELMRKFCFLLCFILRWMQESLQPVHILKSGGERGIARTDGRRRVVLGFTYVLSTFACTSCCSQSPLVGAIAIGDLIKRTLGPKGMVRMVLCRCHSDLVLALLANIRNRRTKFCWLIVI